ncbi:MAG: 2-oxo acid dehydrogenase subunit E2, partial [Bdellovibrionales bacterium]|nr:2-oxo acid dehydrogenase subunit E2 [Bdellovibrionales bacterium]
SADALPLSELVQESQGLVQRARAGKPRGEDLVGGTFSISNVGRFAIESFTAIINPGQGAILAIGTMEDEPIVIEGELGIARVMRASLSVDHRIIDGVVGAEFLTEFKRLLESPILLTA